MFYFCYNRRNLPTRNRAKILDGCHNCSCIRFPLISPEVLMRTKHRITCKNMFQECACRGRDSMEMEAYQRKQLSHSELISIASFRRFHKLIINLLLRKLIL
uniref:Uncharacterized protein n=1 Tax=Populus trichocarpa TaxID=3694 RepID=A0A3N7ERX9_POPTR